MGEALGLPEMLREAAPRDPEGGIDARGAPGQRARARVGLRGDDRRLLPAPRLRGRPPRRRSAAFSEQIELASETLLDFKSALQELLAREGARVTYEVIREAGPPHDRRFEVAATVDGEVIGSGEGRSKKAAEQAAAAEALERRAR